MEKIAVVIVTHNRKDMLQQVLSGVFAQTRAVDRVFLIDNASTDGTTDMVREKHGSNESLVYVPNVNTGSAGGFATGVKAAYEWGVEWVWCLDDDVVPDADCLEKMLVHQHVSKCIHPSKSDINGKEFVWENTYDPQMIRVTVFGENVSFKHGKEITFVHIGCFEGMLIHRSIIEKIGFPDPRFFTAGDDVAYGFCASLYTNVSFVRDAHIKRLVSFDTNTITPKYLYYATRNQFLLKEYSQKYHLFKPLLFYPYLIWFAMYASIKQTIRNGSLKTVYYIWKGILDGARGKFYNID
jgi:rhamnopyranosyl-N-acetylglucosaminyl-diphospho-decaprenol beta-1,3/1,4-galactofuranosyltransferase